MKRAEFIKMDMEEEMIKLTMFDGTELRIDAKSIIAYRARASNDLDTTVYVGDHGMSFTVRETVKEIDKLLSDLVEYRAWLSPCERDPE